MHGGFEHRGEAELGGFGEAALAVGDRSQLARQPELAEAREWSLAAR